MEEPLKLQSTWVTGARDGLFVTVTYSDEPGDAATECLRIVLRLKEEFPRLAEARYEALKRVETLLKAEIQALKSAERDKRYPSF